MYFEVENTPEQVRRTRRAAPPQPSLPAERPCLSLAPFSRPPLVLFEDVPIGSCAERELDVVNPTKKTLQLGVGRAPPPGLFVCLPESQLELAPGAGCALRLRWAPPQPVASRETLHFTDQNRGRYEVILVLKTIAIKPARKMKARRSPPKKIGIISPKPRISKPKKTSPKLLTQKKSFTSYHSTKTQQFVTEMIVSSSKSKTKYSDKENVSPQLASSSSTQRATVCPFDSPASINSTDSFNLNMLTTSDMFSMKGNNFQDYTENVSGIHKFEDEPFSLYDPQMRKNRGILSPTTRHNTDTITNAIDDLTFTPLKSVPKIEVNGLQNKNFFNADLENEFVDSIENKIENETHSIIHIKSQDENDFRRNFNHDIATSSMRPVEFNFTVDESSIQSKKIPNTSSPKQYGSPGINFTINTELSHINDSTFFPQRCSTERKINLVIGFQGTNFLDTPEGEDKTYRRLSSDTYTKPDTPNTSVEIKEPKAISTSSLEPPTGFFMKPANHNPRQLVFNERLATQTICGKKGRNCADGVRSILEANLWQNEKSPPRSLTPPPLQSIPEESTQFSVSRILDKSDKACNTFTINRTFDKPRESLSKGRDSIISSWQKKSIRCEMDIWKKPVCPKETNKRTEAKAMQSITENYIDVSTSSALHLIGDVYAQASTVDPFLSSTYYYDEHAVDKFEKEFKRWLNYILTPPSDLESNSDEQKIDVSKVWVENRNKEIPAAPTREQVSSRYHNTHRLDSVRKSARALMLSSSVTEVFMKLNAQIDKKLIAMRSDKNLHMDIGLQKLIMDLLLCYNPLWLRIGLETIYGTVIPLNSNSDIYGLSMFIIQRMFKDPYAKSKHSHPHVPNMLLPSYVEYIRKFTLKKYFMLVFFLDLAKQKKLIFHDPCLFCRNAPYKESRELLIRFTREVIAGIGDITRHLRPLGYIVSHKQNYLDEYKYAVHNLAIDLKDGIRLSRVMEIILLKPGLMSNMRAPAISRLQKIHNVQVALNALKEADFNIQGDITAKDIADGHREKTLSLLWQLITVFRAPLFEKASIVIQMWWKKKYLGITIEKRIQNKKEVKRHNAASIIQCWWRRVQYDRLAERKMKELQAASIVIQKYWRMWICRSRYLMCKQSVRKIESWYITAKQIKQAEEILKHLLLQQTSVARIQMWYRRLIAARRIVTIRNLYIQYCVETKSKISAVNRIKRFYKRTVAIAKFKQLVAAAVEADKIAKFRNKAATIIQSAVRGWLCYIKYHSLRQKVICCQSIVRVFLVRRRLYDLQKHVVFVQRTFRAKMQMMADKSSFIQIKHATVILQSTLKMMKQRRYYVALKKSVRNIENRYIDLLKMRRERKTFLRLKANAIVIQKYRRAFVARREYLKMRQSIMQLQRRYRAHIAMKIQREIFTKLKINVTRIENRYIAIIKMRKLRGEYLKLKSSAIVIQKNLRAIIVRREFLKNKHILIKLQQRYRANVAMKIQRISYIKTKTSITVIQQYFKNYILMKQQREMYTSMKAAAVKIQRFFRAIVAMRIAKDSYCRQKNAVKNIQRRYRAQLSMKKYKTEFLKLRHACLTIQSKYRALRAMRQRRMEFTQIKLAAVTLQRQYRAKKAMRKQQHHFNQIRDSCIKIQQHFRAYLLGKTQRKSYLNLKCSTILLQKRFRAKKLTEMIQHNYQCLRHACCVIQRRFRANMQMKSVRQQFTELKKSTVCIQTLFRAKLMRRTCELHYLALRRACISVQNMYRAKLKMRVQIKSFLALKQAAIVIQNHYRANKLRDLDMAEYARIKNATILIQKRFRAHKKMVQQRFEYIKLRNSVIVLQRHYRAQRAMKSCLTQYQQVRYYAIKVQQRFRANRLMRDERIHYLKQKMATNKIVAWYRANKAMCQQKVAYLRLLRAVLVIQRKYRAHCLMLQTRKNYIELKQATILIQQKYRAKRVGRSYKQRFSILRNSVIKIQLWYRSLLHMRKDRAKYLEIKTIKLRCMAARLIQCWYRSILLRRESQKYYLRVRMCVITIQSVFRMYTIKSKYNQKRSSAIYIQNKYRAYRLMRIDREKFLSMRIAAIKIQSLWRSWQVRGAYLKLRKSTVAIQSAYRRRKMLHNLRLGRQHRTQAAICIQKYFRTYHCINEYRRYIKTVVCVQRQWRQILQVRRSRDAFAAARQSVIKLQALIRGYLARKQVNEIRTELTKRREEQRRNRAASKIQALFRANRVREQMKHWSAVTELRKKLVRGVPVMREDTIQVQNEYALEVLTHYSDIPSIIRAFVIIEYLTEVYPMIYHKTCNRVVVSLLNYMMLTNRSVSTLDTVRPAAAILVNMARYKNTAVTIYSRDKMANVLKLILRWSGQDSKYYCALCTFMWLFGKYEHIRKDLTAFLQEPENRNTMNLIRGGVLRKQRMKDNASRYKSFTPKPIKTPKANVHLNTSCRTNCGVTVPPAGLSLPALEPDYGFKRPDKPRYFEHDLHAIDSLFCMYKITLK